jgi:hypothetical protein
VSQITAHDCLLYRWSTALKQVEAHTVIRELRRVGVDAVGRNAAVHLLDVSFANLWKERSPWFIQTA